jgi:G3E family GTPase
MRVISVVGFLGSGKTTTILALARHLTDRGQRVAFLVNDAGEVQIDGTVIRAGGHEVVEIFTGCLCLMRDDLYLGLADLARIEGLEWVIIEPSGMADAARLTRLLERFPRAIDPGVAARYQLHKRLSLVDAVRYRLLMRSVRHLIRTSIQVADTIFLNKADLTEEKELDKIEGDIRSLMKRGAEVERVSAKNGLSVTLLDRVFASRETCI